MMKMLVDEARTVQFSFALLFTILVLIGADLVTDYVEGVGAFHLTVESLVIAIALGGTSYLGWRWFELRKQTERLEHRLRATRADAERWQREAQEALQGLGEAIDRQFDRWELTPAEREVALLILKGFSHKEIAEIREVSDRTVRQQAHTVYEKADIAGRAELSAFFLEDLLLPEQTSRGDD